MADMLVVHEIYRSLQGESTWAGLPCVFVRLTGCNLRCSYCDTAHAFTGGRRLELGAVLAEVRRLAEPFGPDAVCGLAGPGAGAGSGEKPAPGRLPLVELTGGEPLLQPGAVPLMQRLCDDGFRVLLETSGALDISQVDSRVHRIVDLKCPGSGEVARNRWENLGHLRASDEIKFVIGSVEDYVWAREIIRRHRLAAVCPLLFSWVAPLAPGQQDPSLKPVPPGQTPLTRLELVERLIADALPVRFQVQMHKVIWPPDQRGV